MALAATKWPQELIDELIEYFDPIEDWNTLGACSVVSQSFHDPSQKQLYSHVVLGPILDKATGSERCLSFYTLITQFPNIIPMVKSCTIEEGGDDNPEGIDTAWVCQDETLPLVLDLLTRLDNLTLTTESHHGVQIYREGWWQDVPMGLQLALRRTFQRVTQVEMTLWKINVHEFYSVFGETPLRKVLVTLYGGNATSLSNHLHLSYLSVLLLDNCFQSLRSLLDNLDSPPDLSLTTYSLANWDIGQLIPFEMSLVHLSISIGPQMPQSTSPYLPKLRRLCITLQWNDAEANHTNVANSLSILHNILARLPRNNHLLAINISFGDSEADLKTFNSLMCADWSGIGQLLEADGSFDQLGEFELQGSFDGYARVPVIYLIPKILDMVEHKIPSIQSRNIFKFSMTSSLACLSC